MSRRRLALPLLYSPKSVRRWRICLPLPSRFGRSLASTAACRLRLSHSTSWSITALCVWPMKHDVTVPSPPHPTRVTPRHSHPTAVPGPHSHTALPERSHFHRICLSVPRLPRAIVPIVILCRRLPSSRNVEAVREALHPPIGGDMVDGLTVDGRGTDFSYGFQHEVCKW